MLQWENSTGEEAVLWSTNISVNKELNWAVQCKYYNTYILTPFSQPISLVLHLTNDLVYKASNTLSTNLCPKLD